MFKYAVIIFQIVIIIIYSITIRTDNKQNDSNSFKSITQTNVFLLGYAFISINYKQYNWTTLVNLLIVCAIAFQWNTLFYLFWTSSINQNFLNMSNIVLNNLNSSTFAVLCILVTSSNWFAKLDPFQFLILSLIQIIGFSLNFVIQMNGIKAIDSGGGMTIWLFASIFSYFIKILNPNTLKCHFQTPTYFGNTLKIIGLIIMVFDWSNFNVVGVNFTFVNMDVLTRDTFFNTVLGLSSAIICSFAFSYQNHKLNLNKFIRYILNCGVLISCNAALIIDPGAALFLGIIGSLIIYCSDTYGKTIFSDESPEKNFILIGVISGILSAIFAGATNNRSPSYTAYSLLQGGLQLACLIVTIFIAIIFGLISGLILKYTKGIKQDIIGKDEFFWDINPQTINIVQSNNEIEKNARKVEQNKQQNRKQNVQQQKRQQNRQYITPIKYYQSTDLKT